MTVKFEKLKKSILDIFTFKILIKLKKKVFSGTSRKLVQNQREIRNIYVL